VNNTKPIIADKIRYYEESFFAARTCDYFHGASAEHSQAPGSSDLPGAAQIDWAGVEPVIAAPVFEGVKPPIPPPEAATAPAEQAVSDDHHRSQQDEPLLSDDDGL